MSISRRSALRGAAAAVAVAGVPTSVTAQPDPLRAGVQALVNEIRQDLSGEVTMGELWALQEAADRLEALPGIRPISNESWDYCRQQHPEEIVRHRSTNWRAIRPVGEVPS